MRSGIPKYCGGTMPVPIEPSAINAKTVIVKIPKHLWFLPFKQAIAISIIDAMDNTTTKPVTTICITS